MSRIDALLILGCYGHKSEEGFLYCNGISNPIIDLAELSDLDYEKIIKFFEDTCGLFDSPVDSYVKCSNILNMLYRVYKVINEDTLKNIQYYLHMHKQCRPYIVLLMREDYYDRSCE